MYIYMYMYQERNKKRIIYSEIQGISLYGRDYAGNRYYNISRLYGKASGSKASSQKYGELETQATTWVDRYISKSSGSRSAKDNPGYPGFS